jgi:anti-sigma regulatory factor (Ser/Thr protein kinase)
VPHGSDGTDPSGRVSGDAAVLRFPADATEVSAVRRFLRETFDAWGLTAYENAELVVSELVSNAIQHGAGPPLVRLVRRSGRVRIEVDDASGRPPVVRRPGHQQPSGRGLAIIGYLALEWGHRRRPAGGKTVWAEVAVS